eukprot:TRINITY_DN16414_c0_g1_i1.p1 TRINITY_DN16414_c0_g1~~TRINITY_DN16414_c0_g1_i1.p1  ORF type:complete len:325 (+),score=12.77 TRINITY_DN16414_c0_g1_i1:72-1046(+)
MTEFFNWIYRCCCCCCTHSERALGEGSNAEKALLLEGQTNPETSYSAGAQKSSSYVNTDLAPSAPAQDSNRTSNNQHQFLGDSFGSQTVVVMRHAERLDEIEPAWSDEALRPWDPPITQHGVQQARIITKNLHKYQFDTIVSSPFTRTIQTSCEVIRILTATEDQSDKSKTIQFFVHPGLSEVVQSNSFYIAESDMLSRGPLEEWFANGQQWQSFVRSVYDQAWKDSSEDFEFVNSIQPEVQFLDAQFPSVPETKEQAHIRYLKIIQQLSETYNSKNVLIVTHGESLQSAVGWCIPQTVVYEVCVINQCLIYIVKIQCVLVNKT